MAEFLLMMEDQGAETNHHKRGDIIVVCEDGHQWGKLDRTNPRFRIIRTSLPVSAFRDLMRSEIEQRRNDNPKDPLASFALNKKAAHRSHRLLIEKLPDDIRAALAAPRSGDGVIDWPKEHVAIAKARVLTKDTYRTIG